jgi:hypothetical protein
MHALTFPSFAGHPLTMRALFIVIIVSAAVAASAVYLLRPREPTMADLAQMADRHACKDQPNVDECMFLRTVERSRR